MQKQRASITRATRSEAPRTRPTIAPADSPLSELDVSSSAAFRGREPGRVRLLRGFPEGGEVYGGGGGAGPLSKEFPSYLYNIQSQS